MGQHSDGNQLRWVQRGSALAVLLLGWAFILVQNNFHVTPPVVFLSLGFFAAVSAIYTLFRTGATAVAPEDESASVVGWGTPTSLLGELEREKRTLLKAIKEAEFDQQMGKLSKVDADQMIGVYRARAIEVIKEIDVLNTATGSAGSVRDRILREARARIEVENRATESSKKRPGGQAAGDGNDKQAAKKKKRADALQDAVSSAKADIAEAKAAAKADVAEAKHDLADAKAAAKADIENAEADARRDASEDDTSEDKAEAAADLADAKSAAEADVADARAAAKADIAEAKAHVTEAKAEAKHQVADAVLADEAGAKADAAEAKIDDDAAAASKPDHKEATS
ncbi:MAG: hypothetical protein H0T89_00245 [Deltaproteobacteria bacterium]|nr:hypothetical protein [Deltaproteobacteria bacterium]MDQ3295253.1 hypothetical protein [Myxococcota bacterium]